MLALSSRPWLGYSGMGKFNLVPLSYEALDHAAGAWAGAGLWGLGADAWADAWAGAGLWAVGSARLYSAAWLFLKRGGGDGGFRVSGLQGVGGSCLGASGICCANSGAVLVRGLGGSEGSLHGALGLRRHPGAPCPAEGALRAKQQRPAAAAGVLLPPAALPAPASTPAPLRPLRPSAPAPSRPGFCSEQCPEGFVAVAKSTLRVVTIERLGEFFNQQALRLRYTPRSFVIHPDHKVGRRGAGLGGLGAGWTGLGAGAPGRAEAAVSGLAWGRGCAWAGWGTHVRVVWRGMEGGCSSCFRCCSLLRRITRRSPYPSGRTWQRHSPTAWTPISKTGAQARGRRWAGAAQVAGGGPSFIRACVHVCVHACMGTCDGKSCHQATESLVG